VMQSAVNSVASANAKLLKLEAAAVVWREICQCLLT
jgi:hypothetical protein